VDDIATDMFWMVLDGFSRSEKSRGKNDANAVKCRQITVFLIDALIHEKSIILISSEVMYKVRPAL
jgi:hypothetical protein